jgi:hypothetical protein
MEDCCWWLLFIIREFTFSSPLFPNEGRTRVLSIHTALDLHSEEARFYTDVCKPHSLSLSLCCRLCVCPILVLLNLHALLAVIELVQAGSGGGLLFYCFVESICIEWMAQSTHTALLCAPLLIFLPLFAKSKNDTGDGLYSRRNNRSIDLHTHTHTHTRHQPCR